MTIYCRDCGRELRHRNRVGRFDPATGVQHEWQELRCPSIRGWLGWHEDSWVWEDGRWVDRTFESMTYGEPFRRQDDPVKEDPR